MSEDASRDEEERNDLLMSGRDENWCKWLLEMMIEYMLSESEEGEGGMFACLSS